MASIRHISTPVVVSHYNVQPVFDVYANTQDSDLGSVAQQVQKIVENVKQHLPRGTTVVIRGQVQSMNSFTWDSVLASPLPFCWFTF